MVGGGSFGPSHPGMMGISANIKTITLNKVGLFQKDNYSTLKIRTIGM